MAHVVWGSGKYRGRPAGGPLLHFWFSPRVHARPAVVIVPAMILISSAMVVVREQLGREKQHLRQDLGALCGKVLEHYSDSQIANAIKWKGEDRPETLGREAMADGCAPISTKVTFIISKIKTRKSIPETEPTVEIT
jgi:hypothetical protein